MVCIARHSTPLPRHPAERVYCSRQTSPTMLLYSLSSWSGAGPNSSYHQQLPFRNHPRLSQHTTTCYTHRATACGASRNIASLSVSDSLEILHLDSDAVADVAEVKRAYYSRMRDIHPDVNPDEDTTDTAALVNAAYAALLKVCCAHSPLDSGYGFCIVSCSCQYLQRLCGCCGQNQQFLVCF